MCEVCWCAQRWEEEQEVRKAAEREAEARTAFEQLDTDSNGVISVAEIQQRMELDDDGDGEVRPPLYNCRECSYTRVL